MTPTNDTVSQTVETEQQPEPAKELTAKEHRKLMGQYWTRRLPRAAQCGHKLGSAVEPRTNCEVCWFTWFNQHGELVQTCDEMYQKHGSASIAVMRGDTFTKMYLRFMGTLAQWQEANEQATAEQKETESHVEGITGTSVVS